MRILPRPLWGPSGSQVCCISLAWRGSSSTCNSWWMAWHPRYQEHNHRSLHHLPAQTHTPNSVSGDLPLTYEWAGNICFSDVDSNGRKNDCKHKPPCFTCLLLDRDLHWRKVRPPFLHSTFLYRFYKLQPTNTKTETTVNAADCCGWVTMQYLDQILAFQTFTQKTAQGMSMLNAESESCLFKCH